MSIYIPISAKTILNRYKFIDDWTGLRLSMNLYRGCEHACLYCDGRTEKYRVEGDFGSEIGIKKDAPELLRRELSRLKEPTIIMLGGGVGDLYQPAEEEFRLSRKVLELILELGLPCYILTKSSLILRDLELISQINKRAGAIVSLSFSSLDEELCRIFEPGAASPLERVDILKRFVREGIPTGVWFMPIIPCICDDKESMEKVVSTCAGIGVDFILPGLMTLKEGRQRDYFMGIFQKRYPEFVPMYQEIYGADKWGSPNPAYATMVMQRVTDICHRYGIPTRIPHRLFKDRVSLSDEVVLLLLQISYLLEIQGKKRTAYKRVAFNLQKGYYDLVTLTGQDRLSEIPGVGKVIASLIKEIVTQRRCQYYEELWQVTK